MMRAMFVTMAAAAALTGCTGSLAGPSDVTARPWQLVSIEQEGSGPVLVDDPSRYTLRLEEDGRVAVRSDCNSCGGSYSMTGSALTLGTIACTRAFCGDASLDSRYVRALEGTKSVAVRGNEMTISGNGITLRFRS